MSCQAEEREKGDVSSSPGMCVGQQKRPLTPPYPAPASAVVGMHTINSTLTSLVRNSNAHSPTADRLAQKIISPHPSDAPPHSIEKSSNTVQNESLACTSSAPSLVTGCARLER